MRRKLRARLLPVLWLFACALFLRVALPEGAMLAQGADGATRLVLCSGQGPLEVVLDAAGKPLPPKPAGSHAPCPFAVGHVWTPSTGPATPAAASIAWARIERRPPLGAAPALPLRAPPPPAQAPPRLQG